MKREICFPSWVSLLSLASLLFVPFGIGLIADTSLDIGNRSNVLQGEYSRFIPPDEWDTPAEPAAFRFDRHEGTKEGARDKRPSPVDVVHRV